MTILEPAPPVTAMTRELQSSVAPHLADLAVTDERAFEALRVASQRDNLTLRAVADEVLLTGDLPEAGGVGLSANGRR